MSRKAKIAQAREWTESSQELPNPLPEILILMQTNPRITYTELAARLHLIRESIRKHIKALREKHKLIFRQGETRGIWITHTGSAE